jgi:hypothetical protein
METLTLSVPLAFSTPVIVIDVPLLAVSFSSESNELQVSEIRRGNLYWKHVVGGRSKIGIYIVTKQELPAFLADCYASALWWTNVDRQTLEQLRSEKFGPKEPTLNSTP